MSGRIPKQFIDDLLVRVDIVDLIDSHLPLKKSGSNFIARCPFHTEKTPSFSVNRNRQIFHCFGCGASGNAISFLMDFSHLDFVEAVEDLATFLGVTVPRESFDKLDSSTKENATRIYAVLGEIAAFYAKQLQQAEGKKAQEYLDSRGIDATIAHRYLLGFAPNHWNALQSRFDQKSLIDAGMLVANDNGKTYDRFRGRLMFPIRDKRQRIIGFGGRVMDDTLPKYLNSPETAVFSKSKELYGLCELLENNSRPKQILIVEGYMDVLSLAQFGFYDVVAALGTATSKTHLDLLFRFTSDLVFCFDGDQAGQQAAWKAAETALPCLRDGRQIKIMQLPQSQDPDSLIRTEGLSGFMRRLELAPVFSDYFFHYTSHLLNCNTLEGRSQLLAQTKPLLEKMPRGFFREMMFARLQEISGTRFSNVPEKKTTLVSSNGVRQPFPKMAPRISLIRKILSLLLQYPHFSKWVDAQHADIENLNFSGIDLLRDILRVISTTKPENSAVLFEYYRDSPHQKTILALASLELDIPEGTEENEFCGALLQLIKQEKINRMNELIAKTERGEPLSAEETKEFKSGGKYNP